MAETNYVIVSGYYDTQDVATKRPWPIEVPPAEMFSLWYDNTRRWARPADVIVINSGAAVPASAKGSWVGLPFNIGHHMDLVGTERGRQFKLAGWSTSFVMGALMAYGSGADYIYKKQDCLAFGPWVDQMYRDLDAQGCDMLVGRHSRCGVEQALMIIRHRFIVDFVSYYMSMNSDAGDDHALPESKFAVAMRNRFKGRIGYLSFGYSRTDVVFFDTLSASRPFYLHQLCYRRSVLDRLRDLALI